MEHEAQVLLEFYDAWLCSLSFSRGRSRASVCRHLVLPSPRYFPQGPLHRLYFCRHPSPALVALVAVAAAAAVTIAAVAAAAAAVADGIPPRGLRKRRLSNRGSLKLLGNWFKDAGTHAK